MGLHMQYAEVCACVYVKIFTYCTHAYIYVSGCMYVYVYVCVFSFFCVFCLCVKLS